MPGIGKILALVLLYEIHDIRRFADVRQLPLLLPAGRAAPTSRPARRASARGKKIGNAHLKWAFSEAACLMLRELPQAKSLVARKEKKHGKAKALSILAASSAAACT